MPRGRKPSSKKVAEEPKVEKKQRKPYPAVDERLAMAEKQIDRLQKLNASREALIAQTEQTLQQRKDALSKSQAALESALNKRAKLTQRLNTPSAKADRRAAASQSRQLKELTEALKSKGKTLEELLAELKSK